MKRVFIGLGSNLESPLQQLERAVNALGLLPAVELVAVSGFYSSKPMGPQDQPDYINAVAEIKTELPAEQLLEQLQEMENQQGRVRTQRWGARTLDLDILLYGEDIINTSRLTVPHCGISERNFVLYPLSDLVSADFTIPALGVLKDLLSACPRDGLTRLTENE